MDFWWKGGLEAAGFKVDEDYIINGLSDGIEAFHAFADTSNGRAKLIWASNGCARIIKPNGSVKWYYDKTPMQIVRIAKQIVDWNTKH